MMKSINDEFDVNDDKSPNLWRALFCKLDKLVRMQLIACPTSSAHLTESALTPHFHLILRMSEHLSSGVAFLDFEHIRNIQLARLVRATFSSNPQMKRVDTNDIIHGSLNCWEDVFHFSFRRDYIRDNHQKYRTQKLSASAGLSKVHKRWESEPEKGYRDWFIEEAKSFGTSIVNNYTRICNELLMKTTSGSVLPDDLLRIINDYSHCVVETIKQAAERCGMQKEQSLRYALDFLRSETILDLPFNRIAASMWAKYAFETSKKRKPKPPPSSFEEDVQVISCLLPYCDAMFLDRECCRFLTSAEVTDVIDFEAVLFSKKNYEAFMTYLDSIENEATESHISVLDEVYGDSWREPYVTMYSNT